MDNNKRYRPLMPLWFTKKHAKSFKKNISESVFESLIDAMCEDKTFLAENGYDPNERRITWLKTGKRSIMIKHKETNNDEFLKWESGFLETIREAAPKYPKLHKVNKYKKPVCFVVSPSDIHVGKLGYDYNLKVVKERFMTAIYGIVQKALLFEVEKIIYVGGNDSIHIDNLNRTTTSGTPQDTDGSIFNMFNLAFELNKEALELLRTIAPVHYVHCMDNHSNKMSWCLSKAIEAYYSDADNITFDNSELHRKYAQYGISLIGFSHGDGAKDTQLADLMKKEAKQAWSNCHHGVWILGHLHHLIQKKNNKLTAKEYGDVTVFRKSDRTKDSIDIHYCHSISGTDTWHEKKGFLGSPKGIDGFIFDSRQGLIAQLTEYV